MYTGAGLRGSRAGTGLYFEHGAFGDPEVETKTDHKSPVTKCREFEFRRGFTGRSWGPWGFFVLSVLLVFLHGRWVVYDLVSLRASVVADRSLLFRVQGVSDVSLRPGWVRRREGREGVRGRGCH